MLTVDNFDFKGKRALVRVDFNVPLNRESGEISDDTRIRAALPTLEKILAEGGSVVIMSHMGRPKSGPEESKSLKQILPHLSDLLGRPVQFAGDCIGAEAKEKALNLKGGEVLLLENLRFYKHETSGSESFAEQLAELGEIYVNDAFGTAHRAHASTAIIARFFEGSKCFGYLMANEIENIDKVLNQAQKPFTAIIGGAKVSSKITIIDNLLDKLDNLIIGGGMAYTFAKALGGEVGNSLVEDDYLETAREVMKKAEEKGVRILIPEDTIAADGFSNEANTRECLTGEIEKGWMGLDIGPKSAQSNHECLVNSKTILWNGPMGVFEMESFQKGTQRVAESVVEATEKGAFSLVGGGDSVAAVNKFNYADKVSYVSTGGGAMLEYMEGKVLPGVKAIRD